MSRLKVTRKHRLAVGLCASCGARPHRPNRKTCEECGAKASAANSERYKAIREQHLCFGCRTPLTTEETFCESCKRKIAEKVAEKRALVLAHYGGKCAVCGETRQECLELHHLNHNGGDERKTFRSALNHTAWVIRHGFPADRQILCRNCHHAHHQTAKYPQGETHV